MDGAVDSKSVYLITHEFYPKRGGIATFTEEIARASAALGYNVEVWAQAAPVEHEKSWPFRLHRLPLKGTHNLSCQLRLIRELIVNRHRLRYATVYLPEPGPMLAMMLLQFFKTFRPQRLILTFHGSEILRFSRNPLTRRLTRRLIRHATRISTLTNYTHQLLCRHFPEAAGKSFLTPGALRSDFAVVNPHTQTKRKKTIILTVGRLHPRKGQLFIIQALQALPDHQRSGIEYWLVGGQTKENYESTLRAAAAQSNLTVRFFGNVPDEELDHIYDRADIFAMTSVNYRKSVEGFGLVYLEAAAHSLPVVAHTVGGVPEAVVDGVTGILVPPHDARALSEAFQQLIANPQLRAMLGKAGHDWARRNCWTRSADLLFNNVDLAIAG